jgi:hypothetical protein
MTPDEIAKLIPEEVVKAAAMQLPGMAGHQRYVREAIAAALAVWPGADTIGAVGLMKPSLILPLTKEGE